MHSSSLFVVENGDNIGTLTSGCLEVHLDVHKEDWNYTVEIMVVPLLVWNWLILER